MGFATIWKDLFKGRLTKKDLSKLFLPSVLILIACWTIAKVLYPNEDGYAIDVFYISRQGNLNYNPVGGWFFILSTVYVGIMLVFYFVHVYHVVKPRVKVLPQLFLLSGIVGGLGLAMVGMFPEGFGGIVPKLHDIGATLGFGSLAIAALFYLIIMICKLILRQPWPNLSQFTALLALTFFFIIQILFTRSGSLTQWSAFYAVFVWMIGMYMLLPEENSPRKEST